VCDHVGIYWRNNVIPWLKILKLDSMTIVTKVQINICIFPNPFSVDVSDAQKKSNFN
jgi:hypothetical protein